MLTDEDRKYILYEFLRDIWGISDIEYQMRVWIRGEGPECDDFTETVCHFFDVFDFIMDNYGDYGISEEQNQLVRKFGEEFEIFSDQYSEAFEFIDTPKWAEIREKAKEVLKAFNYVKKPFSSGPQKHGN